MKQTINLIEWCVEQLGGVARLCVLALVLLVATNVILRYLFSIGPVGLQELEWHLISPIALLGLSYSMKHRADVRVDVLYDHFSPRRQALVDLLASLLTVAVGVIITYLSVKYVLQSYRLNEGSPDPGGLTMRYLLKAFLPLGFGLLALQGVADVLNACLKIAAPQAADEAGDAGDKVQSEAEEVHNHGQ